MTDLEIPPVIDFIQRYRRTWKEYIERMKL
jgi:hypothetical protein